MGRVVSIGRVRWGVRMGWREECSGKRRTWIGVPVRITRRLQLIWLSAVYVWFAGNRRAPAGQLRTLNLSQTQDERTRILEAVALVREQETDLRLSEFLGEHPQLLVRDDDDWSRSSECQFMLKKRRVYDALGVTTALPLDAHHWRTSGTRSELAILPSIASGDTAPSPSHLTEVRWSGSLRSIWARWGTD